MRRNVHRKSAYVWIAGLLMVVACSPHSLVDVQTTSGIVDPSQVTTPSGAIQLYNSAVEWTGDVLVDGGGACISDILCTSGLFTDELTLTGDGANYGIDQRSMAASSATTSTRLYIRLHQARTRLQQARQALTLYAANTATAPKAWQGQLFALEGYTVLWFAELYCSGIPLTSVPLVGTPQPTAGLATNALFTYAATLFDSAIVDGADSAQFVNLAKVGKGRALLGLGHFADAAAAVHDVPTQFVYTFTPLPSGISNGLSIGSYGVSGRSRVRVQDHEGTNGLVWSTDPRTAITTITALSDTMLLPAKYNVTAAGTINPMIYNPTAPVRIADGLEARLIEAEAALANNDGSWLTILNTLRATCIGTAPCAPVPNLTTTNLPDTLRDPGSANARLDLLMHERAMWLYLTGHREGDLRRLAHVYQRDPSTLWPVGTVVSPAFPPTYPNPTAIDGIAYGTDLVYMPDPGEHLYNALYSGCYDTNP